MRHKNKNRLFLICFFLAVWSGYAQVITKYKGFNQEDFKALQIGFSKTTSIVFPYAIKSIDKGTPDVLIEKAKGVENILLLKAAKQNFTQTNLTVVTSDSRLYVFVLNYDDACPDLNIRADNIAAVNDDILFSQENENQKKIEQYSRLALSRKKKLTGVEKAEFEIKLGITGMYIDGDVIYFRLVLENDSKINYDVDQLRFFIRDQKKSTRTAWQEIEILPLYSTNPPTVIPNSSEISLVYALSKFTIPDKKQLTIQLSEKNGGRNLELTIKNKLIEKILPIRAFSGSILEP